MRIPLPVGLFVFFADICYISASYSSVAPSVYALAAFSCPFSRLLSSSFAISYVPHLHIRSIKQIDAFVLSAMHRTEE